MTSLPPIKQCLLASTVVLGVHQTQKVLYLWFISSLCCISVGTVVNPLLSTQGAYLSQTHLRGSLIDLNRDGGLFDLAKTIVSVFRKEL